MALTEPIHATIDAAGLQGLIDLLRERHYDVIGPRVRDDAIVYEEVSQVDQLPRGWTDEQGPGEYRLRRRADEALFGFVVGPDSWKKFLFPPRLQLWEASRNGTGVKIRDRLSEPPTYALLGVRSCELHAMEIQDKVFLGSGYRDDDYAGRRANALIIAVNCTEAGGTCFCVSMGTGPAAQAGYDLALTEILHDGRHRFLIASGTQTGREILEQLQLTDANEKDHAAANTAIDQARHGMGRHMDPKGLKDDLLKNLEHPHWDEVASRCLSCANCTMVCPTCFCSTTVDTTDLTGDHAQRWRRWDSCFTGDFSYVHGGSIRQSSKSRYRQWLTHKLAHWIDQFDTSGCVGCGRCITWCPVGIDLTEEVRTIRATSNESNQKS